MQVSPVVERSIAVQSGMDYGLHQLVGAVQAGGLKENVIGVWLEPELGHEVAPVVEQRRRSRHLPENSGRRRNAQTKHAS